MYTLSGTLQGHEQDIKSVATLDSNSLVSSLRDGTVRLWKKNNSSWTSTVPVINYHASDNSFVNAVAYISELQLIANAGQEGIVYLSEINSTVSFDGEPEGALIGHTKNICALSYKNGNLISCSWDCTAIVWDLTLRQPKYRLTGHKASVWDAIALPESDSYLTCSADKTINRWHGDKVVKTYLGHKDVVRGLVLLQDGKSFASCSNDGTIIIWDLASGTILRTLYGHESFIYDLAILVNGDIILTGEDRSVRIWLSLDGNIKQVITLPCVSVWCVDTFPNGDFVVGGSDKLLRVFTNDSSRYAEPAEIVELNESVKSSAIPEQTMDDLKKTDIPGYDRLNSPGKKEGETVMVKNPAGIIEAHQWSAGEWVKIGDVVGGGGSGNAKTEYLGESYDFVFDVDFEDGKPPLKLPFNKTDNPYEAAAKFLAQNELPASYQNEVVEFILKNTGGVLLDTQPVQQVENPYLTDRKPSPAPQTSSKSSLIFPQLTYISFSDFKPEQLVRGLAKFNKEQSPELQFSNENLNDINDYLQLTTLKQSLYLLQNVIPKIFDWLNDAQLVGYDILRICVSKINIADALQLLEPAETISKAFSYGMKSISKQSDITRFMMLLRVLNNVIPTLFFQQLYCTSEDNNGTKILYSEDFATLLQDIINALEVILSDFEHKQYGPAMTALASFIFNLSVIQIKMTGLQKKSGQVVVDFALKIGNKLVESSSEAAYRTVVAIGNYKHAKVISTEPDYVLFTKTLYVDNKKEKRFEEIFRELELL